MANHSINIIYYQGGGLGLVECYAKYIGLIKGGMKEQIGGRKGLTGR